MFVLDLRVGAQLGRDAGQLITADHDHPKGGDVGETQWEVRQVVLVDVESGELLQPEDTERRLTMVEKRMDNLLKP